MRKFCPSCGKTTEEFYDKLCRECFLKQTKIIKSPESVKVTICNRCHKVTSNKRWVAYESREELLNSIIKPHVKLHMGAKLSFNWPRFKIEAGSVPIVVRAILEIDNKKIFDQKQVILIIKKGVCNICSRAHGGYYEAILQLRGEGGVEQKMMRLVSDTIFRLAPTNKMSFITKIKKLKGGLDVYIGSKIVAERISSEMKKIYNVEIKRTYSQAGMKDGKAIYRETILLRVR